MQVVKRSCHSRSDVAMTLIKRASIDLVEVEGDQLLPARADVVDRPVAVLELRPAFPAAFCPADPAAWSILKPEADSVQAQHPLASLRAADLLDPNVGAATLRSQAALVEDALARPQGFELGNWAPRGWRVRGRGSLSRACLVARPARRAHGQHDRQGCQKRDSQGHHHLYVVAAPSGPVGPRSQGGPYL